MKRFLAYVLVLVLTMCIYVNMRAKAEISPYSTETFRSTSIAFYDTGKATFSASLKYECPTVAVSSCILQKQENGQWVFAAYLTPPPSKSNTSRYSAQKDYSASMTHGITYRIIATFTADGESVTTTSSSADY